MNIKIAGLIFMLLGTAFFYYGISKKQGGMEGLRFRLIFGGVGIAIVGVVLMFV